MDFDMLGLEEFRLFDDLMPAESSLELTASTGLDYENDVGKIFPGDDGPASKLVIDQAGKEVLDDLLLLSQQDPIDLDWMEMGSLEQLLDGVGAVQNTPATQNVKTENEPVVVIKDTNMSHSVLHDLLTQPITIKQSPPVRMSKKSVVSTDFSQLDLLEIEDSVHIQDKQIVTSLSDNVEEVPAEISFDSGYGDAVVDLDTSSQNDLFDAGSVNNLITSPLSAEEIDSVLSGSEPSSPSSQADSIDPNDPTYSPDQSEDEDYVPNSCAGKQKSKKKPRSSPYPKTDKKDRKRDQNKNAAIRYRNKKREESEKLKDQENALLKRNTELNDKVEQLGREIKYMKDLIAEVCKAKGLKVTFKTKKQ